MYKIYQHFIINGFLIILLRFPYPVILIAEINSNNCGREYSINFKYVWFDI